MMVARMWSLLPSLPKVSISLSAFQASYGQQPVDDEDPLEQVVGTAQPAILHVGIGLLGDQEALCKLSFTRAQVPLTGAAAVPIGADSDRVSVADFVTIVR